MSPAGAAIAGDAAYDSDPNTGFPVFDTYGGSGWGQYGGTSDAAPQWAALVAIVDELFANLKFLETFC